MKVELATVRSAEASELLPFIGEFNSIEGIGTPLPRITAALDRLLGDPTLGRAWFICADGVRAGYLVLTFGFDMEYGGREGWITDFYVRPQMQGRGIGTQALELLERAANDLEIYALHLMVLDENDRAKRIYHKVGFENNPRSALIKLIGSAAC